MTYGSSKSALLDTNSDSSDSDSNLDTNSDADLDSSDFDSKLDLLDLDPSDSLDSSDLVSSKGRQTGEGELACLFLGSGSWVEGGASREAPPLGAVWLVRASSGAGSELEWILAFFAAGEGSDKSVDCDRSLVGAAGGWVYS